MKINRFFHKIAQGFVAALVLCVGVCAACADDRDKLPTEDWQKDGYPFLYSKEASTLESIWSALATGPDDASGAKRDRAVDIQLRKQGALYKGRTLDVEGRLLRAVYRQTSDAEGETRGYYDLWLILPDSKRDPIRVLAKNAPVGFQPDAKLENETPYARDVQYRDETCRARAVYYRATAFDAGDDFFAAPTFVALDFDLAAKRPDAAKSQESAKESSGLDKFRRWGLVVKLPVFLALAALWFVARRSYKRALKQGKEAVARAKKGPSEKLPEKLGKFTLLLAAVSPLAARADESDAFWETLANATSDEWRLETTSTRPSIEQDPRRREIVLAVLGRFERVLTPGVLIERADDAMRQTSLVQFVAADGACESSVADETRSLGYFLGSLDALTETPLNEAEKERAGLDRVYRALVTLTSGETIALYVPRVPTFGACDGFWDEPRPDAVAANGQGERVSGLAVRFGKETVDGRDVPTFLAPNLRWNPREAPLSRSGADLGTFDGVKVYPPDALTRATDPDERKAIARSLRWTTQDRAPFYDALAAVSNALTNDKRKPLDDVVALFNRPEQNQGERVRLRGWARRVNLTLVDDPDVRATTGVERYYQLYLFTNESQGRPIVVCVPELPDGLEPGGGEKYRPELEVDGYFYKTWAYRTAERVDAADEQSEDAPNADDVKKWNCAPTLVGRVVNVYPEEKNAPAPPIRGVFVAFALLACAWIVLRRIAAKRANTPSGAYRVISSRRK